jgi:hypothetical protein
LPLFLSNLGYGVWLPGIVQERFDRNSRQQLGGLFTDINEYSFKAAGFLVRTIVARFVKFLRHAGHQRYRAVEQAIDFRQSNLTRISNQPIATLHSLLASHVPRVFEIEKNLLEKLFWNILPAGNVVRQQMPAAKFSAQSDERLERVFAFF